jgi:hypothetical protein
MVANSEYQALLPRLAAAFGAVEQHVAEGARAITRGGSGSAGPRGSESISADLIALERTALSLAGTQGRDELLLAVLRMTGHLRSADRLATELRAVTPFGSSQLSEDLSGHLHRMSDLALAQLAGAQRALISGDGKEAADVLRQDVDLDGMFDLLLSDCLEDLAEQGESSIPLGQVLRTARLLERIGGYAVALAEDAVEMTTH